MHTAQTIRDAVAEVERLRQESRERPELGTAVAWVKRLQARRFAGSYADLLASPTYGPTARFFLDELYGERDYAERDAQFARIAGPVETLFPREVAETAAALARLHMLTESLDHAMARTGLLQEGAESSSYARAWVATGARQERRRQLEAVLALGGEMTRLTRLPGIRMMLRMMRGPATAAGLGALQRFLESGFETFAGISRQRGAAEHFLALMRDREQKLMDLLFDAPSAVAEQELARILGQAA